jgi:hypothetical protein
MVLGLIRMMPLIGEVHFCQREPQEQLAKTGSWIHCRSWAPAHPPAAKGRMESEKEFSEIRRKNGGLMVIHLPQGTHTQHESAAASA